MYVMRRVSILLVMLLVALSLSAQETTQAVSFVFEQTEWDFGRIDERDGVISHSFRFRNEADHSVAIERVYTECGCTSTNYSRRPIRSGQESEFVVTFDPEGRAGRVDRVVTLVYDSGKGRTDLHIKGKVKARPRSVEEDFPYDLGQGLRSDALYKSFGNVGQGLSKSMTMALVNTTTKPVELELKWLERSGLLEVELPEVLGGDSKALVSMTYVPQQQGVPHYGIMRDRFVVLVDGVETSQEIVATAVGTDNLRNKSTVTTECELSTLYHHFGTQRGGAVCQMDVTITNKGDEALYIRALELRQGTTLDLRVGEAIAAGESITRKLTFHISAKGFDTVFGGVMLVVNDAQRPVVELRVVADVE